MSGLKELEIVGRKHEAYSVNWGPGPVGLIVREFVEARKDDPGWECPRVEVFNGDPGNEAQIVPGGALIPGWTQE